ncbi:MAG TPA: glycosyltransferase family 1 protein [Gaiellaceae bacterium]|nr:glycosyltransferase family 1 protein [Gaiellaceae bacterium]
MTIGISLLTLVPGVVGGSETYARELVRALERVGQLDYRVFKPAIVDDLPGETVRSYRAARSMPGRVAAMARATAVPRRLKRELELDRLDAIHFPLTVMLPRVERPPAAVSLLDIQHVFFPEFFSRAELVYRWVVYGWSLRRARKIIAISRHVKETLVERMDIEPERVEVIHLGLDHELFRPEGEAKRPFLLYPANPWPHKNHERLFEAFRRVRQARPELRLVLTGTGLEKLGAVPTGVELRGRVGREELAGLYRAASALVFPSLYEGFGQPPLEAMASGTPVACSRAGSLPEVCGDAALYFDPLSTEEIAEAILTVLDRPDRLIERGLARAASFTWDETARRHDEVYRALAAG